MPVSIPKLGALPPAATFQETALAVAKLFCSDIPDRILEEIIATRLSFSPRLHQLDKNLFCLELFHGPTLAFKDFGASFMAGLMDFLLKDNNRILTILAATSGDTGSAVGQAFKNVSGVRVVLLYPSGKVSRIQEQQLTTIGGNVTALEVEGTFDDCQRLVKEAFQDKALQDCCPLSSANSINIGRLIPQIFYYVYLNVLLQSDLPPLVSVPSGNFGNLTAGIIAEKTGSSFSGFIAATNENDIVPHYLQTADFRPRPSVTTLSNAMDVGNPSNFERLIALFDGHSDIVKRIAGIKVDDATTELRTRKTFEETGYILDPHGAVACEALIQTLHLPRWKDVPGVFLGTAHPAKFPETVERVTGAVVPVPERLLDCQNRKKEAIPLDASYEELKDFLGTI